MQHTGLRWIALPLVLLLLTPFGVRLPVGGYIGSIADVVIRRGP